MGENPAVASFKHKYQLLMAQPALQVMLTSCRPRNSTLPSVFCSHYTCTYQCLPWPVPRGWEEPVAPIPALTPGRKLLSVTVFVLEQPRCQMGRQNVLTLKISSTYSTPQLHQAPKSSLCSLFCCGKCWQGQISYF